MFRSVFFRCVHFSQTTNFISNLIEVVLLLSLVMLLVDGNFLNPFCDCSVHAPSMREQINSSRQGNWLGKWKIFVFHSTERREVRVEVQWPRKQIPNAKTAFTYEYAIRIATIFSTPCMPISLGTAQRHTHTPQVHRKSLFFSGRVARAAAGHRFMHKRDKNYWYFWGHISSGKNFSFQLDYKVLAALAEATSSTSSDQYLRMRITRKIRVVFYANPGECMLCKWQKLCKNKCLAQQTMHRLISLDKWYERICDFVVDIEKIIIRLRCERG